MVKPHFFGVASALGLVTAPHRMQLDNSAVRTAPEVILTEEWLGQFPFAPVSFVTTALPHRDEYQEQLLAEYTAVATQITAALAPGELQVVVGGDHSVTYASMLALSKRVSLENVAYLQLDAHADCNTFASSPTGNFHGIYVRTLFGESGSSGLDTAVATHLFPENLWFIGNLDLDPAEVTFFADAHIKTTTVEEITDQTARVMSKLSTWLREYHHLHISCDLDGFDQQFAPATGIPCAAGLDPRVVVPVLRQIVAVARLAGIPVSLDVVELNPTLAGAQKTTQLARQIIETVITE